MTSSNVAWTQPLVFTKSGDYFATVPFKSHGRSWQQASWQVLVPSLTMTKKSNVELWEYRLNKLLGDYTIKKSTHNEKIPWSPGRSTLQHHICMYGLEWWSWWHPQMLLELCHGTFYTHQLSLSFESTWYLVSKSLLTGNQSSNCLINNQNNKKEIVIILSSIKKYTILSSWLLDPRNDANQQNWVAQWKDMTKSGEYFAMIPSKSHGKSWHQASWQILFFH